MTIVLLVVVFFAVVVVLNVAVMLPTMRQGYRPFRRWAGARPRYAFTTSEAATFRGAQRVGWINASWPSSTLTVDRAWASVAGPIADIWVDRGAVTEVRLVRGLTTRAVFFESSDGAYDGVLFWCTDSNVLQAFRDLVWPVRTEAATSPPSG